jgi:hypothetical protein
MLADEGFTNKIFEAQFKGKDVHQLENQNVVVQKHIMFTLKTGTKLKKYHLVQVG